MIRLFEKDAIDFTTLGIGVLSEAITAPIKNELNGEYELEMTYPVTGTLYNEIQLDRIIVSPVSLNTEDNPQAFRIYALGVPIDGVITINAHHISYDLSKIIVKPFEATTPWEAIEKIQNGISYLSSKTKNLFRFHIHPETPPVTDEEESDDKKDETKITVNTPSTLRSILGGENGMTDTFEGEIVFDNFDVHFYTKGHTLGCNRGFEVRYGSNMTNMERKLEQKNDYNAIYPFYAKKTTDDVSDETTSYRPVYIAKNMEDKYKFTRHWLSLESDGLAMNPEEKLIENNRFISQAVQVKTEGEYKDKLYIYISDSLLNTQSGSTTGWFDTAKDLILKNIRVFEFRQSNIDSSNYIPKNYYYQKEPKEDPQDAEYILDESPEYTTGRVYYEAYLKGTDYRAGHYIAVPKYGYVSYCGDLKEPASGEDLDIDNNKRNNEKWLSFEKNGAPISEKVVNKYMMMLPLQVQDGLAKGRLVIFNPLTNTYKELKNGIEKEYIISETTSEEKTILFDLSKYNEVVNMDTDKIKSLTPYFYDTTLYHECQITPTDYKENTYYYAEYTYQPTTVESAEQFETGVYWRLNTTYLLDTSSEFTEGRTYYSYNNGQYKKENVVPTEYQPSTYYYKENESDTYVPATSYSTDIVYYDRIPNYSLDSSSEPVELRTYYTQEKIYIPTFIEQTFSQQHPYESNKYYYKDTDKYKLETGEYNSEHAPYYDLMVCKECVPPIHQKKYTPNKYYILEKGVDEGEVNTNKFVLATGSWDSNTKYYENVKDYDSALTYYIRNADAPLIYLKDKEGQKFTEDTKVLAVDLSSSIEGDPTGEDLKAAAEKYIEDNSKDFNKPTDSLTTEFVRLSDDLEYEFLGDIEKIILGDTVKVTNEATSITELMKITSIEFDPIGNTYKSIDLGSKAEDLTDTVLTSGSDISSLKNDQGFVDRAEVKHLIAETLDAKNINVVGLLKSEGLSELTKIISEVIDTKDLNAKNIVAGAIAAEDVTIKTSIIVEGYSAITYNTVEEFQSETDQLYYKETKYGDYKEIKMVNGVYSPDDYIIDRIYYKKGSTVFSVDNDGNLYANSATIEGKVTANEGDIGGAVINQPTQNPSLIKKRFIEVASSVVDVLTYSLFPFSLYTKNTYRNAYDLESTHTERDTSNYNPETTYYMFIDIHNVEIVPNDQYDYLVTFDNEDYYFRWDGYSLYDIQPGVLKVSEANIDRLKGIYIESSEIKAGNGKFYVDSNGNLIAQDSTFKSMTLDQGVASNLNDMTADNSTVQNMKMAYSESTDQRIKNELFIGDVKLTEYFEPTNIGEHSVTFNAEVISSVFNNNYDRPLTTVSIRIFTNPHSPNEIGSIDIGYSFDLKIKSFFEWLGGPTRYIKNYTLSYPQNSKWKTTTFSMSSGEAIVQIILYGQIGIETNPIEINNLKVYNLKTGNQFYNNTILATYLLNTHKESRQVTVSEVICSYDQTNNKTTLGLRFILYPHGSNDVGTYEIIALGSVIGTWYDTKENPTEQINNKKFDVTNDYPHEDYILIDASDSNGAVRSIEVSGYVDPQTVRQSVSLFTPYIDIDTSMSQDQPKCLEIEDSIKTETVLADSIKFKELYYYDDVTSSYRKYTSDTIKHVVYAHPETIPEGVSTVIGWDTIWTETNVNFAPNDRWKNIISVTAIAKKVKTNEIKFFMTGDTTAEWDGNDLTRHTHGSGTVRTDLRMGGIEVVVPRFWNMGTIDDIYVILDIYFK